MTKSSDAKAKKSSSKEVGKSTSKTTANASRKSSKQDLTVDKDAEPPQKCCSNASLFCCNCNESSDKTEPQPDPHANCLADEKDSKFAKDCVAKSCWFGKCRLRRKIYYGKKGNVYCLEKTKPKKYKCRRRIKQLANPKHFTPKYDSLALTSSTVRPGALKYQITGRTDDLALPIVRYRNIQVPLLFKM